MPAAKFADGKMIQLDGKRQPDRILTENDVQDPAKLSKELTAIVSDVANKQREHNPRHIDFEGIVSTSASFGVDAIQLQHHFGGKVRWWVVDWENAPGTSLVDSGGDSLSFRGPIFIKDAATSNDVLVLNGYVAGTACIRVEESG